MKPRKQPCILGLFDILQNYFTEEATIKSLEDFTFELLKGLCHEIVWTLIDLHDKIRSRPEKIAAVYLLFFAPPTAAVAISIHAIPQNEITQYYTFAILIPL